MSWLGACHSVAHLLMNMSATESGALPAMNHDFIASTSTFRRFYRYECIPSPITDMHCRLTELSNVVAYAGRASHSKDRQRVHSLPGFDGTTPRRAASAQSTGRNRATRVR